jgi:hypothetical protein
MYSWRQSFTDNKPPKSVKSVSLGPLVKCVLELGYLHVIFLLKLQFHLAECLLTHATEMNGKRFNFTPSEEDCGKPYDLGRHMAEANSRHSVIVDTTGQSLKNWIRKFTILLDQKRAWNHPAPARKLSAKLNDICVCSVKLMIVLSLLVLLF